MVRLDPRKPRNSQVIERRQEMLRRIAHRVWNIAELTADQQPEQAGAAA